MFPGGAVHGVPGDAAARAALAGTRFGWMRALWAPSHFEPRMPTRSATARRRPKLV
jgi:hypothetical protein